MLSIKSNKSNRRETRGRKNLLAGLSLLPLLSLFSLFFLTFISPGCSDGKENAAKDTSSPEDKFQLYRVSLPSEMRPLPEPLGSDRSQPGFKIRGIKGWAWEPEQYLAEIPYLVEGQMNFLMNCYLSMFSDPEKFVNRWWEPIPAAKKLSYEQVVKACFENGIMFCFSLNPPLFSERPFRYENQEDFELLWSHYSWMQGLGVRWFSLSFDDIPVEGLDKASLGESQAEVSNKLLLRLREKDPEANLIICPVYYWGCGQGEEAQAYLNALGQKLHPDIYVFWTGDGIVTNKITVACAQAYKSLVNHRLIIWDNYPVNDRQPVLHLGPVSGREAGLAEVADGYMSNPLSPQNEINRLPLLTCADYAYNPWEYDPGRSIGQSIMHLAETKSQREVLRELVELFPGEINLGRTETGYNSLLEKFNHLRQQPGGNELALEFINYVENVLWRLEQEFPGQYSSTKKTIAYNIELMKKKLG
ncbi:MAG TPA: beta-N-acetylglucosaminidase domain-containing protein [Candidatus Saccharicenans sp.]|nr:beta-N-acetylglucosaminidase domain-containing protein [Candidatus Saccharicenans sp.]